MSETGNINEKLAQLNSAYANADTNTLLEAALHGEFKNEVALFSSFGADSALLISLVAKIDRNVPVLFLDTGKHFAETIQYVESLRKFFGLTNIRVLRPDAKLVNNIDANGELWNLQPNRCCWMRKVEPLQRAVKEMGLKALITGRKRFQTKERSDINYFEIDEDNIFRINPLAFWDREQIQNAFAEGNFPVHPLIAKGYKSIGCAPCTSPVADGQDERAGRWAHTAAQGEKKNECGLHISTSEFKI